MKVSMKSPVTRARRKSLVTCCAALLICVASAAKANTYTVVNTGDNAGVNPAAHAGTGTLRQAIVDSNSDGGTQNVIDFDIPGTGPFTIAVAAQLPTITSNVTIDGFSQSGATPNTNLPDQGGLNSHLMIEIDGGESVSYGFYINGSGTAVILSGLVIDGFTQAPIDEVGKGSLNVDGCFVGTQIDGTAFASGFGNNGVAIRIDAGHANIGGVMPGQRNLISGNRGGGILIGAAVGAVVEGNLIGTDAGGTLPIGSGVSSNWPAIIVPGNVSGVRIGCSGTACTASGAPSRNVISGNHNFGIGIWNSFGAGSTGGLEIKGNFIGTDWSGTKVLPNGDATAGCPSFCGGIQLQNTSAGPTTIIGGFDPGEGNLIAFNHGPGIIPAQNQVSNSFDSEANAIHNNTSANIDIGPSGPTPNDAGDADAGSNNVQNFPVIESASVSNGMLNVTYAVDSATTHSSYPLRIDFYITIDGGSGEYLVSDSYPATSAQLARSVSLPLPADAQSPSGIVATATDANGYTSEFSADLVFGRIFADGFGQ